MMPMINAERMRMLVASAICLLLCLPQTSFGNAVSADAKSPIDADESIRLLESSDLLKEHPACAEFLLAGNQWRPNAAKLSRMDQPDSPSLFSHF
jgi:hypothetical protein